MMERDKEILFEWSGLISRSLSGEITREEQVRLNEWKRASDQNRKLFERICADSMIHAKIQQYRESDVQMAFNAFVKKREQRHTRARWIGKISRYAAILILPLMITLFYFNREEVNDSLRLDTGNTLVSKKNHPVLTLSTGQQMELNHQNLSLQEENGVQITMKSEGSMQYKSRDSAGVELVYNTLTTPSQCDFTFTLADGTRVWLNAQSSLRYPVAFTGDERVVYAEGEIYLEVAKDRTHPFFVVLDGMKVEVVGTSFNINSYADEDYVEVTLVEGHVATHVNDGRYDLFPNRQLRWNRDEHTVDVKAVNVYDYIAWKEGQYIFKGRALSEVAKVLQRWYDVDIIFENTTCGDVIYTGVINKEERIDAFVQRLNETSSFTCRIEGSKIYIK